MQGEIPQNPVTPEDILGIPKEHSKDEDSEGKIKSPDLKPSPELQEAFKEEMDYREDEIVDAKNLFTAQHHYKTSFTRDFWREDSREPDKKQYPLRFASSASLTLNGEDITLRFSDIGPDIDRNISPWSLSVPTNSSEILNKRADLELRFSRGIEDKSFTVGFGRDGKFSWVQFNRVENSIEPSAVPDPINPDRVLAQHSAPLVDLEGTRYAFSQDMYGKIKVYALTGKGFEAGDYSELADIQSRGTVEMWGQKTEIVNFDDGLKIIFYRQEDPEKVGYEITIPKKLEQVEVETGTDVVTRYAWEEEAIPSALRRNPLQPLSPMDNNWSRRLPSELLGIRIDKNIA